jgi:hypothetical protein
VIRGDGRPLVEVIRSYGAIVGVAVAFLVMATLVEPASPREEAAAIGAGAVQPGGVAAPAGVVVDPATGQVVATDPATGQPVAAAPPGATAPGGGGGGGEGAPAAATGGCPDRALQVPGDPYSPPCVAFSGDNGGATARGVTADEIVISVRELAGPTAGELFADLSGQPVITSRQAITDTYQGLADYFNSRFQFYGRRIRLEFYSGQGNGSSELLGAGQERAQADALTVAEEIGAFGDISGITTPYADALSRQGVVNFGAPYPSQQWFIDRAPYAWSNFPDGTTVVDAMANWFRNRVLPVPTVQFAGPELNGQPRVYGVIGPENPEYGDSGDRFGQAVGSDVFAASVQYRIDINSMPNQASNIIAQLKDAGVTSVICFCDPVMLALGLAPKAIEQGYNPEWLMGGLAFVDQDIVGQLIDNRQWQHAFGFAFNAESEPLGRSYPRQAYAQMRPGSEPAFGVEELYYQLYLLSIGLQMAGPNLTPETFAQGMFAYPGAFGPRGTWRFAPGDHTSVDDFREIWWDPERISGQNNRTGAWIELNGGARWDNDNPPSGPADYFAG